MKKIYPLYFAFLIISISTMAQFEKGQKVISGNLALALNRNDDTYNNSYTYRTTAIGINPCFGKFTSPNLLCGIGLNYSYNLSKSNAINASETSKNASTVIGIRLYQEKFFNLSKNFFFTLMGSGAVAYSFGQQIHNTLTTNNNIKSKGFGITAAIAPGLSYKLGTRWLADAQLSNLISASYDHSSSHPQNSGTTSLKTNSDLLRLNTTLTSFSLCNVSLGFKYLLKS